MPPEPLIALSQRYGRNPEYVLAGGGNTSYKDDTHLYVKASGVSLAGITAGGFVKMNRSALDGIFAQTYSPHAQEREAQVLRDLLAARCSGEENQRPSVETLLHHLLPGRYVLHIHPAKVNGMLCSPRGAEACGALFPGAVWVPQMMPGYLLARDVRTRITGDTRLLFLENHGVFLAGDSLAGIDAAVQGMEQALHTVITREPDLSPCAYDSAAAEAFLQAVRALSEDSSHCVFLCNRALAAALTSREQFLGIHPAFTPDHMVYCHDETLYLEEAAQLREQAAGYQARKGRLPKIIGLNGCGVVACGRSAAEADIAAAVFLDALKVAVYGESFGGAQPMHAALIQEINHWEVEHYRKRVSFCP